MAVAFDTFGSGFAGSATTTIATGDGGGAALSVGNNSNRVLVAKIALKLTDGRSVSSISGGGGGTWALAVKCDTAGCEIWTSIGPSTGAQTVTVTLSGSTTGLICVESWYNVEQTTPVAATAQVGTTQGPETAETLSITSQSDQQATDVVALTVVGVPTAAGSNTLILADDVSPAGGIGTSRIAGTGGTVTLSWTSASTSWLQAAISLAVASAPASSLNAGQISAIAIPEAPVFIPARPTQQPAY